eukprot:TRINITY_DN48369_c0_g1_i1.p1 TRINITY_DN48369_c0_g1~~TRINITY_DN48369_c0_g1_i1.p1  ORF type:complete len:424 (-),score=28.92 TRINITY_DN48369_c0_g1_i1:117-1388(-)
MTSPASDACRYYTRLHGRRSEQDLEADQTRLVGWRCCSSSRPYLRLASALVVSVSCILLAMYFFFPTLSSDAEETGTLSNAAIPKREFHLLSPQQAEEMLVGSFGKHAPRCGDIASLVSQVTLLTNNAILRIRDGLTKSGYPADDVPLVGVKPGQLIASKLDHGAQWLVPTGAHPNVFKVVLTGGACGGKTAGLHWMRAALERTWHDNVLAFSMPEVATVLLERGAMNFGAYTPYVESEHLEFSFQLVILQIAYEEIWTSYAECIMARNASIRATVAITDRDALSGVAFSRPIVPNAPESWEQVLQGPREFFREPGLSTEMIRRRYVGAIVLQSIAVMRGRLNTADYDRICRGENGTNPFRSQDAVAAKLNDEQCQEAYMETYPRSEICLVPNTRFNFKAKLETALDCAVRFANAAMRDAHVE